MSTTFKPNFYFYLTMKSRIYQNSLLLAPKESSLKKFF